MQHTAAPLTRLQSLPNTLPPPQSPLMDTVRTVRTDHMVRFMIHLIQKALHFIRLRKYYRRQLQNMYQHQLLQQHLQLIQPLLQ